MIFRKFATVMLVAAAMTTLVGCSAEFDPAAFLPPKPGSVAITATDANPEAAPRAIEDGSSSSRDQALSAARTLLDDMGEFGVSRAEFYKMLGHHDWFSHEDATWAVDSLGVNWNTQALQSARAWLALDSTLTRSELIEQLKVVGFTHSQATYAVDTLGLKDATPTPTPSASVTAPPSVTPTSPATVPDIEPSDNPTMGSY